MPDQRCLAGADIAGDDDEALALRQAIAQIGHCLPVRAAFEIESGIGRQLERASGEAIELIVHRKFPLGLDQKASRKPTKAEPISWLLKPSWSKALSAAAALPVRLRQDRQSVGSG